MSSLSPKLIGVVLIAAAFAWPVTASADRTTAYGQVSSGATVTGRVYYCRSGSYHGALDLAAPCGRGMRAMLYGRRYYRYARVNSNTCTLRSRSGYGNYSLYTGRNGFQFIQAHANHSSTYSRSGYFSKGQILNLVGSTGHSTGPHTHASNMRYWSKKTAWITSYYTRNNACGAHPTYTTPVGKPRIS